MKKKNPSISTAEVAHIASLANLAVSPTEEAAIAEAFTETLGVVASLNDVNTTGVEPTHQVTNLENVWRDDIVDTEREFSQEAALQNAPRTHNGYFVVERILSND